MTPTPGPWTVGKINVADLDGFKLSRLPISGGGYAIAAVWAGDARRRGPIMGLQEMHKANAHLIAAAPDMLAALHEAADYFAGELEDDITDQMANVMHQKLTFAIAKAEGRS